MHQEFEIEAYPRPGQKLKFFPHRDCGVLITDPITGSGVQFFATKAHGFWLVGGTRAPTITLLEPDEGEAVRPAGYD